MKRTPPPTPISTFHSNQVDIKQEISEVIADALAVSARCFVSGARDGKGFAIYLDTEPTFELVPGFGDKDSAIVWARSRWLDIVA